MAGFSFLFLSTEAIYSLTYKLLTLRELEVSIIHLCETYIVKIRLLENFKLILFNQKKVTKKFTHQNFEIVINTIILHKVYIYNGINNKINHMMTSYNYISPIKVYVPYNR